MSLPEQFASTNESTSTSLKGSLSSTRPSLTDSSCVLLILGFVLLTYVATANVLTTQDEHVIPSGDPFTYTLSFIELHDLAHDSLYHACQRALDGNWYWLQNIAILALSPILGRDPASMVIDELFCTWLFSLCALYAAGRQFTRLPPVALLGIAGLVHLPWMYGPNEHGQLLCVTLDCSFLWGKRGHP